WHSELHLLCFFRTTQQVREPCKHALPCEFASDPLDVYFFLPDPKFGCQPAAAPFWLGAAAIALIFSFFGFLPSITLLCALSHDILPSLKVPRVPHLWRQYPFYRAARGQAVCERLVVQSLTGLLT